MDTERDVIPIQPVPIQWFLSSIDCNGVQASALARVWRKGDTLRCQLCPVCTADHRLGVCMLLARGIEIGPESAPLFTSHGLPGIPGARGWTSDTNG
jgi:hypothetical protein